MPRMLLSVLLPLALSLVTFLAVPQTGGATDVDGAGDCARTGTDFGDAPEGFDAYPGTLGRFPTCLTTAVPAGGQELLGCGPFSTTPGAGAGYVRHVLASPGTGSGARPESIAASMSSPTPRPASTPRPPSAPR